jgi:hypothetical protein
MEIMKEAGTTIRMYTTAGLSLMRDLWEMYAKAFEEIDTLAVQSHMMTYEQFVEVMLDERIRKYVATDPAGVTGLSLLTNRLRAWPLISPRYFERHWPRHYADESVWYVGFVAVADRNTDHTLFPKLIAQMYEPVRDSGGVAVMDFCSYNIATRRLPAVTQAILRRLNPSTVGAPIDEQQFWLWEFPNLTL